MLIELSSEQAAELRTLLESALGDLSFEIAATDSHAFRVSLEARRERLNEVLTRLKRPPVSASTFGAPTGLLEELEHPGD